MSIYCDLTPTVNSVPPESDMIPWKPYFEIPNGCPSFEAYIKVNECYKIERVENGAPDEGKCVSNGECEFTIYLNKEEGCESTEDHVVSHSVPYHEDASGHEIYIYVVDASASGTGSVKGGSNSEKTVKS